MTTQQVHPLILAATATLPLALAGLLITYSATEGGRRFMRDVTELAKRGPAGFREARDLTRKKAEELAAAAEARRHARELEIASASRPEPSRVEINAPVTAPVFEAPTFQAPTFQAPTFQLPSLSGPPTTSPPPVPEAPAAPPRPAGFTWRESFDALGIPEHWKQAAFNAITQVPCARPAGARGIAFSSDECAMDAGDAFTLVSVELADIVADGLERAARSALLQPSYYLSALDGASARARSKILGTSVEFERRRQREPNPVLDAIRTTAAAIGNIPDNLASVSQQTRDHIGREALKMWKNAKAGRVFG